MSAAARRNVSPSVCVRRPIETAMPMIGMIDGDLKWRWRTGSRRRTSTLTFTVMNTSRSRTTVVEARSLRSPVAMRIMASRVVKAIAMSGVRRAPTPPSADGRMPSLLMP